MRIARARNRWDVATATATFASTWTAAKRANQLANSQWPIWVRWSQFFDMLFSIRFGYTKQLRANSQIVYITKVCKITAPKPTNRRSLRETKPSCKLGIFILKSRLASSRDRRTANFYRFDLAQFSSIRVSFALLCLNRLSFSQLTLADTRTNPNTLIVSRK